MFVNILMNQFSQFQRDHYGMEPSVIIAHPETVKKLIKEVDEDITRSYLISWCEMADRGLLRFRGVIIRRSIDIDVDIFEVF